MTTDLNDSSISPKASRSTNPNTSGATVFIWSLKSFDCAVMPVTATSVSSSAPTVLGMISSRRSARAWFDVASVPSPSTGMEIDCDRAVRVDVDGDRLVHAGGADGGGGQVLDGLLNLGGPRRPVP